MSESSGDKVICEWSKKDGFPGNGIILWRADYVKCPDYQVEKMTFIVPSDDNGKGWDCMIGEVLSDGSVEYSTLVGKRPAGYPAGAVDRLKHDNLTVADLLEFRRIVELELKVQGI